jgi:hypothetical protein
VSLWSRRGRSDPTTEWIPDDPAERWAETQPHERPPPDPPDPTPTQISNATPLPVVTATPATPMTERRERPAAETPRVTEIRATRDPRTGTLEGHLTVVDLLRSIDASAFRSAEADVASVAMARKVGRFIRTALYVCFAGAIVVAVAALVGAVVFLLLAP